MKDILKNRPFLFILFTAFLSIMGIGLIIPVLPFIVGKYITHNNTIAIYVGLLTSIYAFCQFFASPVIGALSDKFGRRWVLLLCLLGSAIGYILFGIGGSLTILFVARIIDGTTGGDISTAMAYVADVTEPQDRGKYFGIVGSVMGLGFMLGPTIGGFLAHISLSAPLYLAAALTLINMIYGYFVLPETLSKEHRIADFSLHHLNPFAQMHYIMKKNVLLWLMIIGSFYFFAFAQMSGLLAVFYKDILHWTPANLGLYFLVLGIGDMVTQGYLAGKLIEKIGIISVIMAGFLLTGLAFGINVILPIFPYFLLAFVYVVIYAIGSGFFEPAFDGLISSAASPQEQGRVQGAYQSVQSITRIIGPLFATLLYQFGHSLPWVSCVVFSIIGAILLWQRKGKFVNLHSTREN